MSDFPVDEIRAQFPAIAGANGAGAPVFLDNPAGTQCPRRVIEAVSGAMVAASSNLGGYFAGSQRADEIWLRAHQRMAEMLGAASMREVVVGPSMTALTLHLSRSIARTLSPGDEIIVTRMDHEGDISPWLLIAEDNGLVVKWLPFDRESWRIEPEALAACLTDRTRLLALNYASNLTGSINDVAALTATAKAAGAMVFVDAVQFAPHGLIDVQALGCDFLTCSSYKFYGPHLGVLWGREELLRTLPAYKCRCADDALPAKFETGTPQTELLAGLAAAVDHLEWIGELVGNAEGGRGSLSAAFDAATAYERRLTARLIDGLRELPGTTIHGITNPNRAAERVPTVSFTHRDAPPSRIARALAENGIWVWSGHNYAYEVVRHLGIDEQEGVVRIGLAHYTTESEIDAALSAVARAER